MHKHHLGHVDTTVKPMHSSLEMQFRGHMVSHRRRHGKNGQVVLNGVVLERVRNIWQRAGCGPLDSRLCRLQHGDRVWFVITALVGRQVAVLNHKGARVLDDLLQHEAQRAVLET